MLKKSTVWIYKCLSDYDSFGNDLLKEVVSFHTIGIDFDDKMRYESDFGGQRRVTRDQFIRRKCSSAFPLHIILRRRKQNF